MRLIDKDALVEYLERMGNEIYPGNDEYFLGQKTGLMKVVGVVITFPAVEERKHGYWKKEGSWYKCSCCNSAIDPWDNTWMKYCSCCGAIMDGQAICND